MITTTQQMTDFQYRQIFCVAHVPLKTDAELIAEIARRAAAAAGNALLTPQAG